MAHGNSKQNPTSFETAYRFGDFELHPRERLLKRKGLCVALALKVFSATLYRSI